MTNYLTLKTIPTLKFSRRTVLLQFLIFFCKINIKNEIFTLGIYTSTNNINC